MAPEIFIKGCLSHIFLMAKPKQKQKSQVVDSWKKKKWHRILAPKIFNEQVIGETPSIEPDSIIGRTVNSNLMHLTRDMKKQNMNVVFEISRVMGDTAYTGVRRFELNPSSIKRFIRRGKERIDCSFVCTTADKKKARIKPLLVTINNVRGSVSTELRDKTRKYLIERIKNTKSDILVQEIMHNKLQKELRDSLKKIYPLKICDIRVLEFEGSSGPAAALKETGQSQEKHTAEGENKQEKTEANEDLKAENKTAEKDRNAADKDAIKGKREEKAVSEKEGKEKAAEKESSKQEKQ